MLKAITLAAALTASAAVSALAQDAPAADAATKPNILVIFGDDIGQTNICRSTPRA